MRVNYRDERFAADILVDKLAKLKNLREEIYKIVDEDEFGYLKLGHELPGEEELANKIHDGLFQAEQDVDALHRLIQKEKRRRDAAIYGTAPKVLRTTFRGPKTYYDVIIQRPDETCSTPYITKVVYEWLVKNTGGEEIVADSPFEVSVYGTDIKIKGVG